MRTNTISNAYRDYLKIKILDTSLPLFKKLGVKAVKMDDIASILTISKRTLYEIYDNKEQLLFECIKREKETFDDEDALMELVLDAGAEDFVAEDDVFEITADPEAFDDILQALGDKGIETASAEITMVPDNTGKVEGANATNMQKMLDAFDDNDDVQDVYGNYEMDEEE